MTDPTTADPLGVVAVRELGGPEGVLAAEPARPHDVELDGFDAFTFNGLPTSLHAFNEHLAETLDWPRLTKAQRETLAGLYSWARNIEDTARGLVEKGWKRS